MIRHLLCLLLLADLAPCAWGQGAGQRDGTRVEILNADAWTFDERIAPGAQRLIGNVRFKHANAIMRCDSAYVYEDQRVDAFGHVSIDQGDTLHIAGDLLRYNSRDRIAHLEGNVRLRDRDMELTTPSLDYDLRGRKGSYTNGGRIVSHTGENVLTSRFGTYLASERRMIFSREVHLDHPERSITCDTLHYLTRTGIALFQGPTEIRQTNGEVVIRTSRGSYDTRKDLAQFVKRSSIEFKGRMLEGDSLNYDRRKQVGLAYGNVVVTDTAGRVVVRGSRGRHDELEGRSMITGRSEMAMLVGQDTLYLHGDTLFLSTDTAGHRRIQAHRHVRFFKSDLQGMCDTLVYADADSLIRMYHQPVLWSGKDQINGDHIRIALRNGQPDLLLVLGNAFLMSEADSLHFDQVTGSNMTGFFRDNALHRIVAEGNTRTVYFLKEVKDGREETIGVNRADCSRIAVGLVDGQVSSVTFLDRPDAMLYPMAKAPPNELRMKGSEWYGAMRPVDRQDIFRR